VMERGGKGASGEPSPPRPDHFAPEAEPAVDRTGVDELEQHAVGITVDDALDWAESTVTDRVAALLWPHVKLAGVGYELLGNGIVRVAWVDQARDRRRDGDRVAGGDLGKRWHPFTRHQSVIAKLLDGAQRRVWGRLHGLHGLHGRGSHSTSSRRAAPVASMTRRSRPRAMPQAGGIFAKAARK